MIVAGVIALIALVVGYVVWSRSAPSGPVIGPGQSLQNPFGSHQPILNKRAQESQKTGQ